MSEPMQHDDPRLTAYALGELDAAGTAEVEQWLAEHPEALAEIGDIREFGSKLQAALQQEPMIAELPQRSSAPLTSEPGPDVARRLAAKGMSRSRWQIALTSTAACLLLLAGGLGAVSWLSQSGDLSEMVTAMGPPDATTLSHDESELVAPPVLSLDVAEPSARPQSLSDLYAEASDQDGEDFNAVKQQPSLANPEPADISLGGGVNLGTARNLEAGLGGQNEASGDSTPKSDGYGRAPSKSEQATMLKIREQELQREKAAAKSQKSVAKKSMSRGTHAQKESKEAEGEQGKSQVSAEQAEQLHAATRSATKPVSGDPIPGKAQPEKPPAAYYLRDDVEYVPAGPQFKLPQAEEGAPSVVDGRQKGRSDGSEKSGQESKPQADTAGKDNQGLAERELARNEDEQSESRMFRQYRYSVRGERLFDLRAETYAPLTEQAFQLTANAPLSTFALDVDTASYTNVRRFLRNGVWPPEGAIRVEEMVNYFRFADPPPTGNKPFAVSLEVAACPWHVDHQLVRIGVRARDIPREQRRANLVFLLDVSGSMADANKLSLVKEAMKILTQRMTETDRVAIVTYSDTAKVALESTAGTNRDQITQVIESLRADGSTNGAGGIQLAYRIAAQNFIKEGTNRVLLCTDGDFNVGISDDSELVKLITEKSLSGVFLSVFGFGMGNLKDAKLEKLADKGNGHYGYIDDIGEAQRMFVEQLDGTLYTVAKDVKTQVEFNPELISSYRLIGYENRVMPHQDFRDDAKDAGEIGSGHSVTVLYEIVPGAINVPNRQDNESKEISFKAGELFHVRMRYKQPTGDVAAEELFRYARPEALAKAKPSTEIQWAASVAAFGMVLRNSPHKGQASLALVQELAQAGKVDQSSDEAEAVAGAQQRVSRRQEFLELVALARQIQERRVAEPVRAPAAVPAELGEKEALARAAVGGKYKRLLEKIRFPEDLQTYGEFNDYGYWPGGSYAGQDNLPQSYWVYVYPNWFLWGDTTVESPVKGK